jgi:hypothetical protein
LGTSEQAARKRVTRAVERLRKLAGARGSTMTTVALAAALTAYAAPAAPAGMIALATTAALSAPTSAISTGAVALSKGAAVAGMSAVIKGTALVASLLIVISIAAAAVVHHYSAQSPIIAAEGAAPLVPAQKQNSAAPGEHHGNVNVGVILSHQTAIGGGGIGFRSVERILKNELIDPSLQLVPIVEPETSGDPDIAELVRRYFKSRRAIECSNVEAMHQQIDVIVAPGVSDLSPEMLDALERSVRDDGKGFLVRIYLGMLKPGYTPRVLALAGLKEGQYANNKLPTACEIVSAHAIIGDRAGPVGTHLNMRPTGLYGVINGGEALIRVVDPGGATPYSFSSEETIQDRDDFVFATVYTATCGKGRIVGCPFGTTDSATGPGEPLNGLTSRAIHWLAEQPQ